MAWINKEDLTVKELSSLCPTYGLFNDVNFDSVKYFKSDNGELFELSICIDGSLDKRLRELESFEKKRKLLKDFDLL